MANEKTVNVDQIRGLLDRDEKRILKQFLNKMDFLKDLRPGIVTNHRENLRLNKLVVEPGIRPYDRYNTTTKNKRIFSRRELIPRQWEKLFEVIPEEYRETWLAAMMAPGAIREPLETFAWSLEFEKIAAEFNENFYLNEFLVDTAVPWTAGPTFTVELVKFEEIYYIPNGGDLPAAGESPATDPDKWIDQDAVIIFDGPGTIIANEITGAAITPIVTGVIDDTNAVAAIRTVFDAMTEPHKNLGPISYVSYPVFEDYIENYNNLFGTGNSIGNSDLDTNKDLVVKGTAKRLTLRPCTWMGSSQRIITTFEGNIRIGIDKESDFVSRKNIVQELKSYKTFSMGHLNTNIADLETLYVNDQA